jgi:hypothetical protein
MKPLDASIILLGCTAPGRLKSIAKVVESIEKLAIPFKQKIMAIDEFNNNRLSDSWIDKYEEKGWTVTISPGKGMVANLSSGLELVNQHWVFYTEDDVVIKKLPTKEQFARMVSTKDGERSPGLIAYTYVGYQFKRITHERLQRSVADPTQFKRIDDYLFWIRDDSMNYGYHIEFPVTFFNTEVMRRCIVCAKENFKNRFIESALTAAWFQLGINEAYYKSTLLQWHDDIFEDIQSTQPKEYEAMIRNKNRALWVTQRLPTTPGNKKF